MVIKAYNVQLHENLKHLRLHPPKHEKLHPFKKIHSMNICQLHIDQYEPKFYPQVQTLHICIVFSQNV
jgi:hypothetical protein